MRAAPAGGAGGSVAPVQPRRRASPLFAGEIADDPGGADKAGGFAGASGAAALGGPARRASRIPATHGRARRTPGRNSRNSRAAAKLNLDIRPLFVY